MKKFRACKEMTKSRISLAIICYSSHPRKASVIGTSELLLNKISRSLWLPFLRLTMGLMRIHEKYYFHFENSLNSKEKCVGGMCCKRLENYSLRTDKHWLILEEVVFISTILTGKRSKVTVLKHMRKTNIGSRSEFLSGYPHFSATGQSCEVLITEICAFCAASFL